MHIIDTGREDILGANKAIAERVRRDLTARRIVAVNIMGAIGSGKTIMVETLARRLAGKRRLAAIAGDVVSDLDARRIRGTGIPVVGVNTGKECHLDAHLVDHALEELDLTAVDLLLIENVGNLVCPADFDLGTHRSVVVVSSSEGDDTIEKHPMIFLGSDLAIINKIDIEEAVGADTWKMVADARKIKARLEVLRTSFKTGEGVDEVVAWFQELQNG